MAYELYDSGSSYRDISAHFKSIGIKKNTSVIGKLLRREAYKGTLVYGKSSKAKMHAYRAGQIVTEFEHGDTRREDMIVVHDAHTPIVPPDLWNHVNRRISERAFTRTSTKSASKVHTLTGLAYCAACGKKMGIQRMKDYSPRLRCNSYIEDKSCSLNCVYETEVVEECLKLIESALEDGSYRTQLAGLATVLQADADMNNHTREAQESLERAQDDLAKLTARLAEVDSDLLELLMPKVRAAKDLVHTLTVAKEDAEANEGIDHEANIDGTLDALSKLRSHTEVSDPALLREVWHNLIDRVDVVVGHVPHGSRKKYHLESVSLMTTDGIVLP